MFTLGVLGYAKRDGAAGYVYGKGGQQRRQAMDMRSFQAPQCHLLAFPGEEPPTIDCNDDAGDKIPTSNEP
jgi:hypothetical protein